MRNIMMMVVIAIFFICPSASAKSDIDPQDLYNWQIQKQGMIEIGGITFLGLELKNPDEKAVVKEVKVFVDLPTGIIVSFQYEFDGVKRTFVLRGDKFIEYLGKDKKLL